MPYVKGAPRKMRKDSLIGKIYDALPTKKSKAIPTRVVGEIVGRNLSCVSLALKNLEEDGFISKCMKRDFEECKILNHAGNNSRSRCKLFWYVSEKDTTMSLNLEGLRKECGRSIYENIRSQKGMQGMVPWHQVDADHKRGFEKMAGVVFACLFRKHPEDLIKFFTDGRAD